MTDAAAAPAAAPVAAPSAPSNGAAPTGAADAATAPQQPGETAAEARERRRIALAELADDDEIVSIVDGREVVEPAKDWRRRYQQGISATRKYQAAAAEREQARQEAARVRQEAEQIIQYLREPEKLFAAILEAGGDPLTWAEQVQAAHERERQLSPEARELRRIKMQQERDRAEMEARAQQARAYEMQRLEQTYRRTFDAVSARAGIPQVPEIREAVDVALANAIERAMQSGRQLGAADLVAVATQAYKARRDAYAAHLDAEAAKAIAAKHAPPPSPVTPAPVQKNLPPRQDDGRFTTQRRGSALDAVLRMQRS